MSVPSDHDPRGSFFQDANSKQAAKIWGDSLTFGYLSGYFDSDVVAGVARLIRQSERAVSTAAF